MTRAMPRLVLDASAVTPTAAEREMAAKVPTAMGSDVVAAAVALRMAGHHQPDIALALSVAPETLQRWYRIAGCPMSRATRTAIAPPGYVTSPEAAELSNLSRVTVQRRCRRGEVPGAYAVGGDGERKVWMIPESEVPLQRERAPRHAPPIEREAYLTAAPLTAWLARQAYEQAELSKVSGVPERRIYGLRKRETRYVRLGVADRLVGALGARLDDVWDDPDADLARSTEAFYLDRVAGLRRPAVPGRSAVEQVAA